MNPAFFRRLALPVLALALAGCASTRQTDPPFTATQQLLISTAVDRAVGQLQLDLPPATRVFVDPYVDMDGTYHYPRYAIAAVRSRMLQLGARLVPDRAQADVVVEVRSGAQSVNDKRMLVGMPGFAVPVPLAGTLALPEIPVFKYHRETGISKLALAAYTADGRLIRDTGPQYGESMRRSWSFLFVFSRSEQDLMPE